MKNLLQQFNSVLTEGASIESIEHAIYHRIDRLYPDVVSRYGMEVVGDTIRDVASRYEGLEELGSSDISIMVREVLKKLESGELSESKSKAIANIAKRLTDKNDGKIAKTRATRDTERQKKQEISHGRPHTSMDDANESSIMKGIKETKGLPFPGTYEQENNMFKHKGGQERTQKIAFEGKKKR